MGTTLPGVSYANDAITFTLYSFGSWTVSLSVTDQLNNSATQVITIAAQSPAEVSVSEGHALLRIATQNSQVGTHQFTISVADSDANIVTSTLNYAVKDPISVVDTTTTIVDHLWGENDGTSVVLPIDYELSGFQLSGSTVTAENGISATVNPSAGFIEFTGEPTNYENSQLTVPLAIMQNGNQVASVSKTYALVAHNGTLDQIGTFTCNTIPYLVGDVVGLDPFRAYPNSPSVFKQAGITVQVATGSALPTGLSLDSITGIIYGTLLPTNTLTSTLNYVDSHGNINGVVTIEWNIYQSQFSLVDELPDGQIQAQYNGTVTTGSTIPLVGATIVSGQNPTGLAFSLSDSNTVALTGTPTVAGFFDVIIQVTNAYNQNAYMRKRLAIDYVAPLSVVTTSLPPIISNVAYGYTLNAVGGTSPYTWAITTGSLPAGITLNPDSGELSGTTALTTYSQMLTFQVTDTRGVTATRVFLFAVNNTLSITTPVLPLILPGELYQFNMQAQGGSGSYKWSLASGSQGLPGGFTLSSTGLLSGATSLSNYTSNINIQVTDSSNNVATKSFAFNVGTASGLLINTDGIGMIVRGQPYQGTVYAENGVAPYSWSVSVNSTKPIPSGMTFVGVSANGSTNATLSGTTTADLTNYAVEIQVVDANGNRAYTSLFLNTYSSLTITSPSPLPQATVGIVYSTQLTASGANQPFTWSLGPNSPPLPYGMSLSSAGVIYGTPTAASNTTLVIEVTDSISDFTHAPIQFIANVSTLAITSSSLPNVYAGVPYSASLSAGGGKTPYTWSIDPSSSSTLPPGISLNSSTGAISGTTTMNGWGTRNITFRVTDSVGVVKTLTISMTVIANLKLYAGPDYVESTSTNSLGLVAHGNVSGINPRTNHSFCVVATGCVSTQTNQINCNVPQGYGYIVSSVSNGVAVIVLNGPFNTGSMGNNNFHFTISDSGVSGSSTFTWTVVPEQSLSLVSNGSLPLLSI